MSPARMLRCSATSRSRAALSRLVQPKYGREDFDATHGVDTSEASVTHSQIPSEWIAEAIRYEPVNVGVRHVFSSLPFRHEDYHLVDLGCGKGRTLMVGAEHRASAPRGAGRAGSKDMARLHQPVAVRADAGTDRLLQARSAPSSDSPQLDVELVAARLSE